MPEEPEISVSGFEWRLLPDFSGLLNRLGQHGFTTWNSNKADLQLQLETLRSDPEQDIFLLKSNGSLCGYAIVIPEQDIDRTIAAVATTEPCRQGAQALLDSVIARTRHLSLSQVHIAVKDPEVEPRDLLPGMGFEPVTANLELTLSREDASAVPETPLPDGFTVRPMRSSAETLLLTRVQNKVFKGHWGFSRNTPEEVQARLDLPSTGPQHVLFAESPEGDIAAYVWTALEWDGGHTCGKIWMTGVKPGYRKSGIGKAIITVGIKHLFSEGAADIHLEVVAHNTAAVRIYRQMGFIQTGRTEWYGLELSDG